ncbi:hypothetical protein F3Y22_tig00112762pilonHSYRG00085 [Hibiscus syriacus]|uniref:Late embryogenesis abundant protein LEA-2 subgroup domain-containing protein n=1 Tax=Hibiscus syriacus TaxID=106335 RepID=A0A6A2Y641_HIBSY|nr:NDR1/HIN1-like protein 26 [Hibiscus syriacus]KAE8664484.1 hypothetical protein F3Y22_tig00112762pilonHSYRG00085 [Hibiscus syriacus]
MSDSVRLPVRDSRPQPQAIKHHHSARYYAHRVHESFTAKATKVLCAIFLFIFLFVGVFFFILWLSLHPHRPRFHTIDFTVPTLAQQSVLDNSLITFNVTARNSNQHMGIYYDSMVVSAFYKDQRIGSSALYPPFSLNPKTTTIVQGTIGAATLTVNTDEWKEFMNDRQHGTVVFRLEITSGIRFRVSAWKSKHHKMHADCDVSVGSDGSMLPASKNKKCPVYFT